MINPRALIQKSLIILFISVCAFGQNDGEFTLTRSRIAAGGGTSSGGPYALIGTFGQPDAGEMSGGDYELLGGFFPGGPICMVDFYHFAKFAEHWLETDCNDLNNWCGGADLDQFGNVDLMDLELFADEWLCCCPYNWPLK